MDSRDPAGAAANPSEADPDDVGVARPGLIAAGPNARPHNEPFRDVLARNFARRDLLKGAAAMVPVLMAGAPLLRSSSAQATQADGLTFTPIAPSTLDQVVVPPDYTHQVLLRWGDPLFADAPDFDPDQQTPARQRKQFGFNCDFLAYFPLAQDRALLCVNHETTAAIDMFTDYVPGAVKAQANIEIAAHGGTVVEIRRKASGWSYVQASPHNRRITAETPMLITGPAAGRKLMRTGDDPSGTQVLGMLGNCAGGKTPWGTWLTCEENFDNYFANAAAIEDADVKAAHARYTVPSGASVRRWENFHKRFDCAQEPHEPFRFGWVVEIDPTDPDFVPRKRTALGRIKHEGASTVLAPSGRVVVYCGDDSRFEYVYKFVSAGKYDPADRAANLTLLDKGTLHVAKFHADGTGRWIALDMHNPILAERFANLGEILIKARLAADAVGATAMDRPEDIGINPITGKVYMSMTGNSQRSAVVPDEGSATANPRVPNLNGHVIELTERDNAYGGTHFAWDIFLLCGDASRNLITHRDDIAPGLASDATFFAGYAKPGKLGKIAGPDNLAFDAKGNLWIATDGQPGSEDIGNVNDALHAVPTGGADRGHLRQFLAGPKGCEVTGPEFAPDGKTLFCSIQHPGGGGGVPNAISTWPDGKPVARPSVIAIRHNDGKVVGR